MHSFIIFNYLRLFDLDLLVLLDFERLVLAPPFLERERDFLLFERVRGFLLLERERDFLLLERERVFLLPPFIKLSWVLKSFPGQVYLLSHAVSDAVSLLVRGLSITPISATVFIASQACPAPAPPACHPNLGTGALRSGL